MHNDKIEFPVSRAATWSNIPGFQEAQEKSMDSSNRRKDHRKNVFGS